MKNKIIRVGNKFYSHKSVIRLVKCHSDISQDPKNIIRSLIQNELAGFKNSIWNGPPFDPRTLASILGILCEKSDELTYSEDAELHPAEDGRMVIRYNPNKPKARQNFSIAHEIAHTYFPGFQNQYKARHKIGKFDPNNEVEILCDLGASEIIMPTPEFDLDVKSMGVSLKSLQELSKRYSASLEATAIRMIGTNLHPCAITVLDYSHKPSEKDEIQTARYQQNLCNDYPLKPLPMKLRVQYSVRAKRFSVYIQRDKLVEESSPLYKVSVTQKPFQGNTTIDFTNPVLNTYVEAMSLPTSHNSKHDSRVLAIVFL